jgi:prepilin-type N-terminal cleavage/methylation domain-containing protein
MSNRAQSKIQKGFTIIEVMIVLAIAGVILLMVFLAIPALQRNNRNTQTRNDVASVLGFVSEYASNNNGALPGSICSSAAGEIQMIAGTSGCAASATAKVGNIRAGTTVVGNSTVTMPPVGTTDTINVRLGFGCNGNALGTASGRSVAAMFQVLTASSTTPQCQSS